MVDLPETDEVPTGGRRAQSSWSSDISSEWVVNKVPIALRVAAAWAWRLILVGIVVWFGYTAFTTLAALFVPLVIAMLIAAPLERLVARMAQIGIHRALGSIIAILTMIGLVAGLGTLASNQFMREFDELRGEVAAGFDQLLAWLVDGPLAISQEQIDEVVSNVEALISDNAMGLASGALSVGSAIGMLFAGIIIALIALFFFMRDGRKLWTWTVNLLPDEAVERVDRAGTHGWTTLRRYAQTTVFVAFVDAVGIGLAAWLLGVPLALPIAIIVFLFSFVPMVGATLSGTIASLVALVDGGWTTALLMLGAVLLVQQIEGNVLYPWLFGKAASIHPLAVLLTISAGTLMLGLVGAIIAVPIVAFCYAFNRGLRLGAKEIADEEAPPISSQVPVIAERSREAIKRARVAMSRTGEIRVRRGQAQRHQEDASAPEEREPTRGDIPVRKRGDEE